jgi:sugar lactone lactonase YvrE
MNHNVPVGTTIGELELIHAFSGAMPTGVSVSHGGRIFVNFPRWDRDEDVTATVVELHNGDEVPFPTMAWNQPASTDDSTAFVSVQSIVVDPADRLWVLDTGRPEFELARPGGPKLVGVDLTTDTVFRTITFDPTVALETTYLNDVRFDLRRGGGGVAFITDSSPQGPNGLIVVDLETGEAWRRLNDHRSTKAQPPHEFLPVVEGEVLLERKDSGLPSEIKVGADGIAISADGSRLFYCALISDRWFSVSTDALIDRQLDDEQVAETVVDEGHKGSASDGLESDDAGRLYATAYEHNAVFRRLPDGTIETLVHDPRLLWPDTMSVAIDGHLYVIANQLHRQKRFHNGQDRRERPFALFRTPIDAGPVLHR